MESRHRFDFAVIGRGMFGSATARHAAETGAQVVAIGPTTPPNGPHGVYSSHDDASRLTRRQDRDDRWADMTAKAIAAYESISAASGVKFHHPVGCLIASRPGGDANNTDPHGFLRTHQIDHEYWEPGVRGWTHRWPHLDFPATHAVAYEPSPAGYIEPKRLIAAQEVLATRAGATFFDDIVVSVAPLTAGGFELTTGDGRTIIAQRVVAATGAFANTLDVTPTPVAVETKTEVVILGEVSAADGAELASYPTVKYINDGADLDAIYMVAPVRYPDGRHYVKMGANTRLDTWPTQLEEIQQWFESDAHTECLPLLAPALAALWPSIDFVSYRTRPCIVTYTTDGYPVIEEVRPGFVVATGGNGAGAKGSDAWGAMAARLALDD